jgi:hypothetical protein
VLTLFRGETDVDFRGSWAIVRALFSASAGPTPRWNWWDVVAGALGLAVAAWIIVFKITKFVDLAYTGDGFTAVQLATSWMRGAFLWDNMFGRNLAIHTYLFTPVLGLLAKPFGFPGLVVAQALAAAAGVLVTSRLLRLLQVPAPLAAAFAFACAIAPASAWLYDNSRYGFHVELLVPPLAMALLYALLRRSVPETIAAAAALMSVKEEMPILAGVVAAVAFFEDLIAGRRPAVDGAAPRGLINWHALAVGISALAAVPLLLHVIHSTQGPTSPYSMVADVLRKTGAGHPLGVARYTVDHLTDWLSADSTSRWAKWVALASFGLAVLRPHLVLVAIPLSLVAWLTYGIDWAPRIAPSVAFSGCVAAVAFASAVRATSDLRARFSGRRWPIQGLWIVLAACVAAAAALVFRQGLKVMPSKLDAYTLRTGSLYSRAEIADADSLFARYRREGTAEEQVVVSEWLVRYAHDRNFKFDNSLSAQPGPPAEPKWILSDGPFLMWWDLGIGPWGYDILERRGRFVLYRHKPPH